MTKEEAIKVLHSYKIWDLMDNFTTDELQEMINAIVSTPSLPSNLDEAAQKIEDYYDVGEEHGYLYCHIGDIKDAFKAGAEWMAGQGWSLDGEIKDQPTGGGDFEIYLDYDRDKMEDILDEICDYVNANYPDADNRYKVVVQIRKK